MKILDLYFKRKYNKRWISSVRSNYKKLSSGPELTKEQEKEIQKYFEDLIGIKVSLDWHRYFYKRTGVYSPKYIPTDLYYSSLIEKFNRYPFNEAYTDKNLTDRILTEIKQPITLIKNTKGYYYINNTFASKEDAIRTCWNLDDVIIKPTFAAHGEGVKKFSVKDGITSINGMTVEKLFDSYNPHFMIQKVIHQHADMATLNPSSVNTIRILTYRSGMEILVLYTVIRIGRKGFDVDNETAGGISTKINADGTLCKYAFGAVGNDYVERTDTGVILEGYKIPSFQKSVELVKQQHYYIPHFDLIGWDIAIEEDGTPILIEWNTWPELSQSANGPAFGDYTERVLKEIWGRPNTRNENWG